MSFWDAIPLKGLAWDPIKKATGLTDAQMAGISSMAVAAPYALPAMGTAGATAPAAGQGGLLSTFSQYAGPASQAMNIAGQAHALSQGQPIQAPQMHPVQGQGFAGLLSPTDQVDTQKRKQAQQLAVQGLLGGYRG